ncbi:biopolymer transporter ExbD [Luteolibacter pohnpeiensis]|uniref:Biopolymer transporter ExbD n=1 Tax=Luteolibacter pohnpeiensis TaxID=454153 RepID=A0A934VWW6_9BACT|nr:biopolymer transporter ExbD [Luteolibacter pohnpeiensis]MBK1882949.1 biopolymer transporter ExbD [Luteolibacter pohnpeiensis]
MKFTRPQAEPVAMQLAPMCDILFLLLGFFIISFQFSKSETELNVAVPTAEEGVPEERARGEIMINVLADGTIRVEGQTVTRDELQNKLTPIAKLHPNQPVRLRGDSNVAYQRIVEIIDTCKKSGIWNISFATQQPKTE